MENERLKQKKTIKGLMILIEIIVLIFLAIGVYILTDDFIDFAIYYIASVFVLTALFYLGMFIVYISYKRDYESRKKRKRDYTIVRERSGDKELKPLRKFKDKRIDFDVGDETRVDELDIEKVDHKKIDIYSRKTNEEIPFIKSILSVDKEKKVKNTHTQTINNDEYENIEIIISKDEKEESSPTPTLDISQEVDVLKVFDDYPYNDEEKITNQDDSNEDIQKEDVLDEGAEYLDENIEQVIKEISYNEDEVYDEISNSDDSKAIDEDVLKELEDIDEKNNLEHIEKKIEKESNKEKSFAKNYEDEIEKNDDESVENSNRKRKHFDDAIDLIFRYSQGTVEILERKLKISDSHAKNLLEDMVEMEILYPETDGIWKLKINERDYYEKFE